MKEYALKLLPSTKDYQDKIDNSKTTLVYASFDTLKTEILKHINTDILKQQILQNLPLKMEQKKFLHLIQKKFIQILKN